jgi:hypothetical protein
VSASQYLLFGNATDSTVDVSVVAQMHGGLIQLCPKCTVEYSNYVQEPILSAYPWFVAMTHRAQLL